MVLLMVFDLPINFDWGMETNFRSFTIKSNPQSILKTHDMVSVINAKCKRYANICTKQLHYYSK